MNELFGRTVQRDVKYVVQFNPNHEFLFGVFRLVFNQLHSHSKDQSRVILIPSGQYNHKLQKTVVKKAMIKKKNPFDQFLLQVRRKKKPK